MLIFSNIYFLISIFLFLVAQVIRTYRWKLILSNQYKSGNNSLLLYISLGSLVNVFVPFNLGDIFRNYLLKTFSKHSFSDGISATVIERLNDIFYLFIIFTTLSIFFTLAFNPILFLIFFVILLIVIILIKYKFFQIIFFKTSRFFPRKIQIYIFDFIWNLLLKVKAKRFLTLKFTFLSLIMWGLYFFSYYLLSLAIDFNFDGIINIFHSDLSQSRYYLIQENIYIFLLPVVPIILSLIYLLLCGLIMKINILDRLLNFFRSFLITNPNSNVNFSSKLGYEFFLQGFFNSGNYLYSIINSKMFTNIEISKIFEGGSGALTIQCFDEIKKKYFVKKITTPNLAKKLKSQFLWLQKNSQRINTVPCFNWHEEKNYSSYEMEFNKNFMDFSAYILQKPIKDSQIIFKKILADIHSFHQQSEQIVTAPILDIKLFINQKVIDNLTFISKYYSNKINLKSFYINNEKHKFDAYFLDYTIYLNVFSKFPFTSDIHGDLTIENILVSKNNYDYLLIDSNSDNIFNSPLIDYGKLFQSLNSNYEYYNLQKEISIQNNTMIFNHKNQAKISLLKQDLLFFINKNFSDDYLKAIYLMEIVNFIRLMPYKINQNRSNLFFSRLILLMKNYKLKYVDNKFSR